MSTPLAPKATRVLPANPPFCRLFPFFLSGGKGEAELCSVPLVQGNAEGRFAQTGVTSMGRVPVWEERSEGGGSVYTRESKVLQIHSWG